MPVRAKLATGLVNVLGAILVSIGLVTSLYAHHEAIFGPQSATLISRKQFVSGPILLH